MGFAASHLRDVAFERLAAAVADVLGALSTLLANQPKTPLKSR